MRVALAGSALSASGEVKPGFDGLTLASEIGPAEIAMAIASDDPSDGILRVRCTGVSQLRLTQLASDLRVGPLMVSNMAARGWDSIMFQVNDYEEEAISFCSETLAWHLESKVGRP